MKIRELDVPYYSDEELMAQVCQSNLPQHVAIIMDGNGRWASERQLPRSSGHREGVQSVCDVIALCRDVGISALTLYAFSLENWKRPRQEVTLLMELFRDFFQRYCGELIQQGIRFRTIGRIELLPATIQTMIRELEQASIMSSQLTVTLALSYGGRDDIVQAVQQIVQRAEQGLLDRTSINEVGFGQYLSMADTPDPDLVIRTSGESRVSNFLLWQMAYAELYFTKTLWPDFRRREMLLALLEYQTRERRLGGLSVSSGIDKDLTSAATANFGEVSQDKHHLENHIDMQHFQPVGMAFDLNDSCSTASWLD